MNRDLFKTLLNDFNNESDFNKKIDLILSYDIKTLTDTQIDKLLSNLDEIGLKQIIHAINKKIEG